MGVEFDEENIARSSRFASEQAPVGMVGWLVSHHIAKDESSANRVLVIIALLCFAAAIYFSWGIL